MGWCEQLLAYSRAINAGVKKRKEDESEDDTSGSSNEQVTKKRSVVVECGSTQEQAMCRIYRESMTETNVVQSREQFRSNLRLAIQEKVFKKVKFLGDGTALDYCEKEVVGDKNRGKVQRILCKYFNKEGAVARAWWDVAKRLVPSIVNQVRNTRKDEIKKKTMGECVLFTMGVIVKKGLPFC